MIYRCPSCQKRISRNTVSCRNCGWSLGKLEEQNKQAVPEPPSPNKSLQMHMDAAIDALARKQYSDALNSLNRAIIDAPKSKLGDIYSLRGYTQLMLKDHRRAEADCSTAMERRGPDSETLAWRAAARGQRNEWKSALEDLIDARLLASSHVNDYQALIQTYREEASRYFGEMVQQGNSGPDLFSHRGWVYLLVGNFEKSVRDFQLALNQDPSHAWAMLGMVAADLKLDRPRTAAANCRRLHRKGANNDAKFHRMLLMITVRCFAANNLLEQALSTLNQLRDLEENQPMHRLRCGQLAMEIGDYVSAIEDFSQIIEHQPVFLTARRLRSEAYAAINNFQSAENDLTAVLRMLGKERTASLLTQRGELKLLRGKVESAMRDFDMALKLEDVDSRTFLGRARALAEQKQLEQALEESEKAIRLDKTIVAGFVFRGRVLFDLNRLEESEAEFTRAMDCDGTRQERADCLYGRGTARYELGQYKKAVSDFLRAEKLQPNHAGIQIWKAASLVKLDKFPAAIESLQAAISTRPATASKYRQLGRPVAERAIEFFDRQLNAKKLSAGLFRSRGMAYQFLGDSDSAIENYTHAIDTYGFDADTHIRRGQMLAAKGKHRSALRDFTRVLQKDKRNHLARYCRAASWVALKKMKRAWKDIVRVCKLSPEQPRYLLLKGELLQCQNRVEESIRVFTKSLTLDPNDAVALRRRGTAFLSMDQNLQAIGDFTRSLEIDPRQPEVISLRGTGHFKNGNLEQAQEDFELALTRNPSLVKAYCGRAKILTQREEYETALIWLTKAMHRFRKNARALSELLIARGKIFYQMGRFAPAIVDFSAVMEWQKFAKKSRAMARYGRALALVQQGDLGRARQDFAQVITLDPAHMGARSALEWLDAGQGNRPPNLAPPKKLVRPHRPPQVVEPVELEEGSQQWAMPSPMGDWIVRREGKAKKEYGPVTKATLDQWVREGRVDADTRLLRADWNKWKRAAKIYPELMSPEERESAVEPLPEIAGLDFRPKVSIDQVDISLSSADTDSPSS